MNADDLVLNFKKGMANPSKTERRRATESVRDVIRTAAFDDAAGSAYEIERCPRCGSVAVVKKGKSKNGEQRYLCRGCGRTFGMGSERILGTSRFPKETWMAYAECFVLILPLCGCATRCRVCLKTACTMCCRLIACLSAYSSWFRAGRGCGCELDETYFPESFKGNHAKGSFTIPRSLPSQRQAGAQARPVARTDLRHDRVGDAQGRLRDDHRVPLVGLGVAGEEPRCLVRREFRQVHRRHPGRLGSAEREGALCCATGRRPRVRRGSGRTASPGRPPCSRRGCSAVFRRPRSRCMPNGTISRHRAR